MADSEVRQKELMTLELKAMIRKIETFRTSLPDKLRIMQRFYDAVFEAGMRAGEIAQREKIIKAVCTGCRLGWPEQGRPGHGIVIHVPPDPRGLYACQAVAIRALPAAPEEKKS